MDVAGLSVEGGGAKFNRVAEAITVLVEVMQYVQWDLVGLDHGPIIPSACSEYNGGLPAIVGFLVVTEGLLSTFSTGYSNTGKVEVLVNTSAVFTQP